MRFYGSMTNGRGHEVTAGNADNAHLRGWNAGVRVSRSVNDRGEDTFTVYMTSGSNGGQGDVLAGVVTDTPDGPRWAPSHADKEAQNEAR